jgi:PEP-CTERM motif
MRICMQTLASMQFASARRMPEQLSRPFSSIDVHARLRLLTLAVIIAAASASIEATSLRAFPSLAQSDTTMSTFEDRATLVNAQQARSTSTEMDVSSSTASARQKIEIPEPGSMMLVGAGLLRLAIRQRRLSKKAARAV